MVFPLAIPLEIAIEKPATQSGAQVTAQVTAQVGDELRPEPGVESTTQLPTQSADPVNRILQALTEGPLSAGELRNRLKLKHRPTFRDNYLHPAVEAGYIEMTIPDKPNSRLQKYRLTEKGKHALEGVQRR